MSDWLVTLANGESFIVKDQPDEEEAGAAASQVVADHFCSYGDGATDIVSIEPTD